MDVLIGTVFHAKLEAGGANISLGIKIGGYKGGSGHQHKAANIKFSAVKQEGVDVFLHDECSLRMFYSLLIDMLPNLLHSFADLYSAASI